MPHSFIHSFISCYHGHRMASAPYRDILPNDERVGPSARILLY